MSFLTDAKSVTVDPVAPALQQLRDVLGAAGNRRAQGGAETARIPSPYPGLTSAMTQLYGAIPGQETRGPFGTGAGQYAPFKPRPPQAITSGSRLTQSYQPSYLNQEDPEAGGTDPSGNGGDPYIPPTGGGGGSGTPQGGAWDFFSGDPFNLPGFAGPFAAPLTGLQLDALSGFQQFSPQTPIVQTGDIRDAVQRTLGGLPAFDQMKGMAEQTAPFKGGASQAGGYLANLFGGGGGAGGGQGGGAGGPQLPPYVLQPPPGFGTGSPGQPSPYTPPPYVPPTPAPQAPPVSPGQLPVPNGAPVPITGPNPQSPANPPGAPDPNYQGSLLGGAPATTAAPLGPSAQTIASILAMLGGQPASQQGSGALASMFGIDPSQPGNPLFNGYLGFTGLVPNTGAYGGLNLSTLNDLLVPQGYLAGSGQRPLSNPGAMPALGLFQQGQGSGGSPTFPDPAALQAFLQQHNVQYRAAGGLLDPDKWTMVGEQGPELIPPGNSMVMPLQQAATQASQTALSAPRFDLTEMFKQGENVFNTDLSKVLGQQREEMSAYGLNPGAVDRNRGLTETAGNALNQFRLGQQNIAMQSFNDSENRRLGALNALPATMAPFQLPFDQAMQAAGLSLQGELGRGQLGTQQQLANAQSGLMGSQSQDIMGRLGLAQQMAPYEQQYMGAQTGLLGQQGQDIMGRLGIAQSQNPYQQMLMQQQGGLMGAQGVDILGRLGLAQQMQPWEQQYMGAQTGQINAQTGLLPQQFGLEQELGRGNLALQQMLGMGGLNLQGQQISANERMNALPYMLQQENQPWERMFATNEAAANRQMQLLGMMPALSNLPFQQLAQQYQVGEQARGVADEDMARMIQDWQRRQGGGLNELISLLSNTPLMNQQVSPSLLSQLGNVAGGVGSLLAGI